MGNIEIGKFFKQNLEDFKQNPPEDAFEKIINSEELMKFDLARQRKKFRMRFAVGAFAVVAVVAGLLGWLASSDETKPEPAKNDMLVQNTKSDNVVKQEIPNKEPAVSNPVVAFVPATQPAAAQPVVLQPKNENVAAMKEAVSSKSEKEHLALPPVTTDQDVKKECPVKEVQPAVKQNAALITPVSTPSSVKQEYSGPFMTDPLQFSHDTTVCSSSKLTLFVKNAQQVYWNVGLYGETIEVYPEQTTRYVAQVTKFDGTDTTVVVQVNVFECKLYIPNAFSPNGDGLNDEFLIQAPEDAEFSNFEMSIFETSGRLIFHSKNITQGWDGTYLGKKATQSAYLYIITYKDQSGGKHYEKGQVYLYR